MTTKQTTPNIKLLSHTMNPELVVACAGKLCYSKVGVEELLEKQTDESVAKFVNMLSSMGHESPLEHGTFTFAIEGVSRAMTHQLVRHRIASYSQQSQRYVSLIESFEYVMPPKYKDMKQLEKIYKEAMDNALNSYVMLARVSMAKEFNRLGYVEAYAKNSRNGKNYKTIHDYVRSVDKKTYLRVEKECIEDARYVLPNAAETKIVVTMNARSLINFFNHRTCDRAQWEIREVAETMLLLVKEIAENIFAKSGPNCVKGPCPEGSMCCGKLQEKREKFLNK